MMILYSKIIGVLDIFGIIHKVGFFIFKFFNN